MNGFRVVRTERVTVERPSALEEMYTLSPYVWGEGDGYAVLLRLVPRRDDEPSQKISRIYLGSSKDGLNFKLGNRLPILAPGPGQEDRDGCEDPTLALVDGKAYVYYSGWNETQAVGQMLLAQGPDIEHLTKKGIKLASTEAIQNPKEATLLQISDGTWRLFFEYSAEGASKIGLASAPDVDGPWTLQNDPFAARPDQWDSWHLSPGPMLTADPERPVMFYNGATKETVWRIGWVAFDADCANVVARGESPLFEPPPPKGKETDIAFAASCVEVGEEIWLYYSLADQHLFRTVLQPMAPQSVS
ncbi:glycoside hydrolase family 130 protein [soil metagenome]